MDPTPTDIAGTTVEADRPKTWIGRTWYQPEHGVLVAEIADAYGEPTDRIAVVQDLPGKQDSFSVDIWQRTPDLDKRINKLLGRDEGQLHTPGGYEIAAIGPRDVDGALGVVRDRIDAARRGWTADDLVDARAQIRIAALLADGNAPRQQLLVDADRSIAASDLREAGSAVDRIVPRGPEGPSGPGGDDPEGAAEAERRQAKAWALESAHGSRSMLAWEAKLQERGYGLVPKSDGNQTSYVIRDMRTMTTDYMGKTVAHDFALEDLGFKDDAGLDKLRASWEAGRPADLSAALVRESVWSSARPQAWSAERDHAKISASAARADHQRHGQGRAWQSLVATLPEGTWRAVDRVNQSILAERRAAGDQDQTVPIEQLDAKLAAAGISFGVRRDLDGTEHRIGLADRLAETKPPPETERHMQQWMSSTVWATQSELVAAGKPPSYETYAGALAAKGIEVEREYDAETKGYAYSYTTTLNGVGRFSHSAEELGFDAKRDPRLDTHTFVEAGEKVAITERAKVALREAHVRADRPAWRTLIRGTPDGQERAVAAELDRSGFRVRIMQSEPAGRDFDDKPVFAVRYGLEDKATGRIVAMGDIGAQDTTYYRADGTRCDGEDRRTQDTRPGRLAHAGEALRVGIASIFNGDRNASIWDSRAPQRGEAPREMKPQIEKPSWDRKR
jgi:hypothetical protein